MGAVQCPSTTLGLELRRAVDERADGCTRPTDRASAKRNGGWIDTLFDALVPSRARDWISGKHVFKAQVTITLQAHAGGFAHWLLVWGDAVELDSGIGRDKVNRNDHLGDFIRVQYGEFDFDVGLKTFRSEAGIEWGFWPPGHIEYAVLADKHLVKFLYHFLLLFRTVMSPVGLVLPACLGYENG
ncbi:hypothetical protein RP29_00840 [Acidovorax temperans]|uniref:Uncharacterized protein n=1 Tax=Acidovorax temperans TaxID=80878 RepID=A0A0D7KDI0_9BURK|nr:hypothetical protein RP29_00840 [Acidovorax temperans]